MGNFQAKGVTLKPFFTGKAVEQVPASTTASAAETSDVQDFFENFGALTPADGTATPDAAVDPFGALRAAVEGNRGLVEQFPVPTAEEIVTVDPTLNSFADGTVTKQFEQLKMQYTLRRIELEAKRTQGTITPEEMAALEGIGLALVQIEEEAGKTQALAQQAFATYRQELELLQQVGLGKLDPQDADVNGDGRFGFITDGLVLGKRVIDGHDELAVLVEETMKPAQFDKKGFILGQGVVNPNATWDLSASGLSVLSTSAPDSTGADLVVAGSAAYLPEQETYEGSDRTYKANINIPVPEVVWVKADALRRPLIVDGRYEMYQPDSLGTTFEFTVPPAELQSDYIQVQVTDVGLYSVDSEPPINWPADAPWNKKDELGYDHVVEFKDKDGNVIFKMRITGQDQVSSLGAGFQAPGELASPGTDYMAASTMALTFSAGTGDNQRTSHVALKVGDFKSTGNALQFFTDRSYPADTAATLGVFDPWYTFTEPGFKGDKDGKPVVWGGHRHIGLMSAGRDHKTGIGVFGLHIVGNGSAYNDVFDIPPLDTSISQTDPRYHHAIDMGDGYNAVFIRGGSHNDIAGATFADIEGRNGDINWVQTRDVVSWKELDDTAIDALGENQATLNETQTDPAYPLLSPLVTALKTNDTAALAERMSQIQKMAQYAYTTKASENRDGSGIALMLMGWATADLTQKTKRDEFAAWIEEEYLQSAQQATLGAQDIIKKGISTYGENPKVYVHIHTPGSASQAVVGNPIEPSNAKYKNETRSEKNKSSQDSMAEVGPTGNPNDPEDEVYNDDEYDISAGLVLFTNPYANDLPYEYDESEGSHPIDMGAMFKQSYQALMDELHSDPAEEDAGAALEDGAEWVTMGPAYQQSQSVISDFFAAFGQATGTGKAAKTSDDPLAAAFADDEAQDEPTDDTTLDETFGVTE